MPVAEEKEREVENLLEEIVTKNFPNLPLLGGPVSWSVVQKACGFVPVSGCVQETADRCLSVSPFPSASMSSGEDIKNKQTNRNKASFPNLRRKKIHKARRYRQPQSR